MMEGVKIGIHEKTVWCPISINQVVGPYYSDKPIVDGCSYIRLLNKFFLPMTPSLPPGSSFQQDRASPHCRMIRRQLLDVKLSGLWIQRGGPIPFPAGFQDLASLNCFVP